MDIYRHCTRNYRWPFVMMTLLLACSVNGQNIHFSQNYAAHLTLNPANTCRFNGDMRAALMYRSQGYQFSEAYNTLYLSFEKPFFLFNERINTGLYYSHDSSLGNSLPSNLIYFNVSHEVPLSLKTALIVGLQMGYVYKTISLAGITFPDQYSRSQGGFDPSLPTSEAIETTQTDYLDVGFGLLYAHSYRNVVWSVGFSAQQLNRPKESFFGIDSHLPLRTVLHGKADLDIGASFFMIPSFILVKQGEPTQTIGGFNFGYSFNQTYQYLKNIILGIHYRNGALNDGHALIFSGGASYNNLKFITSYDFDISGLRTSNVRNASFEFSLVYTLPSIDIYRRINSFERY